MKIIDKRLLLLYDFLKKNEFTRETVAEYLGITTRQLTRLLKKWQDENLLEYEPGRGRGNKTGVLFRVEVEQEFVNNILNNFSDYSVEELTDILTLPITRSSKSLISYMMQQILMKEEETQEFDSAKLMNYIYRIPQRDEDLSTLDVASSTLFAHTTDRLYEIQKDNTLNSYIVAYDKWKEGQLHLHIYHDIYFTNGHQLFANDIVLCLKNLIINKKQFQKIKDIKVTGRFSLVIEFRGLMNNLKYLLADITTSLYKKIDGQLIGTGPYYIAKHTDDYIILKASRVRHHRLPDVTEVILVNDSQKYKQFYDVKQFKNYNRNEFMKSDFIIINPLSHLKVNERLILMKSIKNCLENIFEKDTELLKRKFNKVNYTVSDSNFSREIKMLVIESYENKQELLYQTLLENKFNIKKIEMSFIEYLMTDLEKIDVDIIWMNTVTSKEWYYYRLIIYTKIGKLFMGMKKSQWLIEQHESKEIMEWMKAEEEYETFIVNKGYFLPVSEESMRIYMPEHYYNLEINRFGSVKFASIIVDY